MSDGGVARWHRFAEGGVQQPWVRCLACGQDVVNHPVAREGRCPGPGAVPEAVPWSGGLAGVNAEFMRLRTALREESRATDAKVDPLVARVEALEGAPREQPVSLTPSVEYVMRLRAVEGHVAALRVAHGLVQEQADALTERWEGLREEVTALAGLVVKGQENRAKLEARVGAVEVQIGTKAHVDVARDLVDRVAALERRGGGPDDEWRGALVDDVRGVVWEAERRVGALEVTVGGHARRIETLLKEREAARPEAPTLEAEMGAFREDVERWIGLHQERPVTDYDQGALQAFRWVLQALDRRGL